MEGKCGQVIASKVISRKEWRFGSPCELLNNNCQGAVLLPNPHPTIEKVEGENEGEGKTNIVIKGSRFPGNLR
jgi:hypothetical protein